jgi:cell division transport system permease protein
MSLAYSIKEGVLGLRRAKFASVASTSAMAVALILIGLFMMVSSKAQEVSTALQARVGEMEIFLSDNADDELGNALHQRAMLIDGVQSAEYVSRNEAMQIFERDFGDGSQDFFDQPFLPPSIRVRATQSYSNEDSLESLVATFKGWPQVDDAVYNKSLLAQVQRNLRAITSMGLLLGSMVVLASIFLVANTVRLTIYARRLLIRTMKLVGATDSFVQRPFVVEGILQGLIAAIVATGVVAVVQRMISRWLADFGLVSYSGRDMFTLVLGMLVLGAVLGWLGSFLAARRFIKKVALH